jgi:hypothetical protein
MVLCPFIMWSSLLNGVSRNNIDVIQFFFTTESFPHFKLSGLEHLKVGPLQICIVRLELTCSP